MTETPSSPAIRRIVGLGMFVVDFTGKPNRAGPLYNGSQREVRNLPDLRHRHVHQDDG